MRLKSKLVSVFVLMFMISVVVAFSASCEGGTKSPECAHENRLPTLYTGENLGICEGSQIIVMTCESCGDQMFEIFGSSLACELSDEAESGVTKNGNAYSKINETCKICGANYKGYNEITKIECSEINDGYLKITKNNDLVLDMSIYYVNNHSCPDTESKKINISDLTEKETCGGYIEIHKCPDCGETVSADYDNIACGVRGRIPEYSEFTDKNGVKYGVSTSSCADCGLKIVEQKTGVELNCCVEYKKHVKQIIVDGKIIHEYVIEERFASNHYYYTEYTYVMFGETCEDGYAVTEVCKRCGYISKYKSSGHIFEVNEGVRFPEPCSGNIEIEVCRICGETVWRKGYFGEHTSEKVEEKNYTDGKGIEHYYYLERCTKCGVEVSHDEYTISGEPEASGDIVYVKETVTYEGKSYSYETLQRRRKRSL